MPAPQIGGRRGMNRETDLLWSRCGLNIAQATVARHAAGSRGSRPALVWPAADGGCGFTLTYGDLNALSNRFAAVLQDLSVAAGEVVAVQTGRIPPLYIAALGTWKNRSLFCPLYAAFGPDPVFHRLSSSRTAVLITDSAEPGLREFNSVKCKMLTDICMNQRS